MKAFKRYALCISIFGFLWTVGQVQAQCDHSYGFTSFKKQEVQVFKDLSYSYGNDTRQQLDAYVPPFQVCEKADVLLLIHGGSFSGGSKQFMDEYALHFARRGFFVFNMNYRLFFENHPANYSKCAQLAAMDENGTHAMDKAWYLALQDARAAVRYATKSLRGRGYEINNVFVFGISAGAITALNLALVDDQDIILRYPQLMREFGSLDAVTPEPYNEEPVEIAAVSSVSGTMGSMKNLTPRDSGTDLIFFHGFMDEVIDYNIDRCFPTYEWPMEADWDGTEIAPAPINTNKRLQGPGWMINKIDTLSIPICYEFFYSAFGGHDIYATFDRQIRDHTADFFFRVNSPEEELSCNLFSNVLGNIPFEPAPDISESISLLTEVQLAPNPTLGALTLSFRNRKYSSGLVRIYDLQGRLWKEEHIDVWQGMNRSQMDVSDLPQGYYTLVLKVDDRIARSTFVRTNQARALAR